MQHMHSSGISECWTSSCDQVLFIIMRLMQYLLLVQNFSYVNVNFLLCLLM